MTTEARSRRPLPERAAKTERLDLRLSPDQKHLFEEAAAASARTVTDFVVQAAAISAQDVLADRTRFTLSAEQWAAFAEALDREPRYLPRLAAFLAEPSVLERE
jgi:uncharacterized protein (DUF1778 family)